MTSAGKETYLAAHTVRRCREIQVRFRVRVRIRAVSACVDWIPPCESGDGLHRYSSPDFSLWAISRNLVVLVWSGLSLQLLQSLVNGSLEVAVDFLLVALLLGRRHLHHPAG